MNNAKFNYSAAISRIAWALLLLTAYSGCTYDSKTITGTVVDESGTPLNDVTVSSCYSGWGWSSGYVVWDKNFCSKPVSTNKAGLYLINFKGPDFMRLRAKKEGWIQTQDFNSSDSQVILTRSADHSARISAAARLRENNLRQRLPDESAAEYYCRVILSRSRTITLDYQGKSLSITPSFLKYGEHREVLFALRGSAGAVSSFSGEVQLRINGQTVNGNFSFSPLVTTCSDLHFMGVTIPSLPLGKDERLEILVPSISAMFDMQIWEP